jgi:hypothetical protein
MQASEFEYRHQTLIHQLLVAVAVLTYLIDRDDIVWRFVRDSATPHRLERLAFIVAALFIATGAAICTKARAYGMAAGAAGSAASRLVRRRQHLGEIYAIGLGSLVPLEGFVILVGGEALRVFRLMQRDADPAHNSEQHLPGPLAGTRHVVEAVDPRWMMGFRQEAVKWGILLTMIVFVITLVDRHADVLAAASFLVGNVLNAPEFFRRSSGVDTSS